MPFKYEVNGHVVEFDNEPTHADIDEAAKQLGAAPDVSRENTDSSLTKTLSSSEPQKPSGDPVIDALTFAQKEIVGPVAQGANTAAFGIPKAVTKAVAGDEFAKQAFPQQSTGTGKALRFGSEATGLIGGGTGQVAAKIAKRIIPKTGATLGQKIVGNAVAGAASGATVAPEDFGNIADREKNAILGGVAGAVIPALGAAATKIPAGTKSVSQNIYNNIVRLPTSAVKFAKDPLEVFSKEKIVANSTDDFAKQAQKLLEERTKQLNAAVSSSDKKINVEDIIDNHLADAVSKSKGSLKDRSTGLQELQYAKDAIVKKYGDLRNISIQKAVELKRQLADDFPFIQEDPNNINTKAAHKIYHDISDAVEIAHPEIKDLNQRVSGLIDISNAAKNRALVESRNNPFGVIDTTLGLGGTFLGGGPVTGIALVAAKKALSSPFVQTRVAKSLAQLSEADLGKVLSNNPWLAKFVNRTKEETPPGEPKRLTYQPQEVPQYLKDRQNIPQEPIPLGRPDKPYAPGPEAQVIRPAKTEVVPKNERIIPKSKGLMTKSFGAGAAALAAGTASQAEAKTNIDINKINQIESSGREKVIGDDGKAFGLNQIHAATLKDYNKANNTNHTKDDLLNKDVNNKVADWYLNNEIPRMLKAIGKPDTVRNRLIAYNAGINKVKKGSILSKTTTNYLKKYGAK